MFKVFIDGKEGTTGLKIFDRLKARRDIELLTLDEAKRKDAAARRLALNYCDIAILCLPDDAARESVSMIENDRVRVIDASTAHRTAEGWVYGMPELFEDGVSRIRDAKRVAVPGCHASGFVALTAPLVAAGVLQKNALLSCTSMTGYSGGGRRMIAEYESDYRDVLLKSPRLYGLAQSHKHLPEIVKYSGLTHAPVFCPVVASYYCGMLTTIPLFTSQLCAGKTADDIRAVYESVYRGGLVQYRAQMDESGYLSAGKFAGNDGMEVSLFGNDERLTLVARYDNLGKGASGAALQCLNILTSADPAEGLSLGGETAD